MLEARDGAPAFRPKAKAADAAARRLRAGAEIGPDFCAIP